jgi:hypothetical protein
MLHEGVLALAALLEAMPMEAIVAPVIVVGLQRRGDPLMPQLSV